MAPRPLNVGLIGGGGGAFIVHPHQRAIHFDGTRRVTAAALHPDPKVALEEAENWEYPMTGYTSYDEMIESEAKKATEKKLKESLDDLFGGDDPDESAEKKNKEGARS